MSAADAHSTTADTLRPSLVGEAVTILIESVAGVVRAGRSEPLVSCAIAVFVVVVTRVVCECRRKGYAGVEPHAAHAGGFTLFLARANATDRGVVFEERFVSAPITVLVHAVADLVDPGDRADLARIQHRAGHTAGGSCCGACAHAAVRGAWRECLVHGAVAVIVHSVARRVRAQGGPWFA
jgi:hypothetical protein